MRYFLDIPKFFDPSQVADISQEEHRVRRDVVRVQADVVKGTAQFIWSYRRQLRRAGAVDFDLPRGARLPPWMAVVLETLRLRPGSWRVVAMRGPRGGRRYRVRWLGWGMFSRGFDR